MTATEVSVGNKSEELYETTAYLLGFLDGQEAP